MKNKPDWKYTRWKTKTIFENKGNLEPLREIIVNGKKLEYSKEFRNLHTKSYHEILKGQGFTIQDARKSIELVKSL